MQHKPINIQNVSLIFPHRTCFENFNTQIPHGSRIAIIGNNGSGKSSLLKMLLGEIIPTQGSISIPEDVRLGYVPQVVEEFETLSGAQRFNKGLTKALGLDPNVLLLDEPTNHLDLSNRKSLMRMLRTFPGTLIIVSHDVELLRSIIDTIWHIDNQKIHIFSGTYDNYIKEKNRKHASIEKELSRLDQQKKEQHRTLMQEQERAKKRKSHGEKKYGADTLALRSAQSRGQATSNKKRKSIASEKQSILDKQAELRLPEVIIPNFSIDASDVDAKVLISINEGSVGYEHTIIDNINFSLGGTERVAITGDNGSGKSTLIKAILNDPLIKKTGEWHTRTQNIGYLDQHYSTLDPNKTVLESIHNLVPDWPHVQVRRHLNDFLFRTNEEVNSTVAHLSGGERARLSLAQIAAKTPALLILDEITNNLDLETKNHVIQVLKKYPGSILIVSHDTHFLQAIGVTTIYLIKNGALAYDDTQHYFSSTK